MRSRRASGCKPGPRRRRDQAEVDYQKQSPFRRHCRA